MAIFGCCRKIYLNATNQQCSFSRIRDHVESAIGPAVAVIKVFDTAHELQKLHMPDPCSDLFDYLSVMKYKSCRLC